MTYYTIMFRIFLIIGCSICICSSDDKVIKDMGVLGITILSISLLLGCFVR